MKLKDLTVDQLIKRLEQSQKLVAKRDKTIIHQNQCINNLTSSARYYKENQDKLEKALKNQRNRADARERDLGEAKALLNSTFFERLRGWFYR